MDLCVQGCVPAHPWHLLELMSHVDQPWLPPGCCPGSGLTFVGFQLLLIHGKEVQVVQVVLVAVVQGRSIGPVGHVRSARRWHIRAAGIPMRRLPK